MKVEHGYRPAVRTDPVPGQQNFREEAGPQSLMAAAPNLC